MNLTDWIVVGGGALLGWGLVSWIITVVRQQRAPPVPMGTERPATPAPAAPRGHVSLAELGRTWHVILGVSQDAGLAQIEAAYRERIAEFDRSAAAGGARAAERSRLDEAFEFVRTLRRQSTGSQGSL